jgi:phosphate transport system protein
MSDAFEPGRPEPVTPARARFHNELDAIDDAFVAGAVQVGERLPELTAAFLAGDQSVMTEAVQLSVGIGERMEEVQDRGFVLLALEAPVAGDLRRLVALLRLASDVDRSAALLKHVCLTLERFDPRYLDEDLRQQLSELATRSGRVYTAGIDAWRHKDALAVMDVDDADEDVDRLQQLLLEKAAAMQDAGDEMLVLGLIARYYERIADHGVAIAQDATFVATGQRVKVGKQRASARRDTD